MNKLQIGDLMTLETYAQERNTFRQHIMTHKKNRHIPLGDYARLIFEDRQTVQYQIQEMLRIERIFEKEAIQEELDAYNPLIPDGQNLKATFMLEYPNPVERKVILSKLIGVENSVWLKIGEQEKIYPICNEDLERSNDEKTASVHFMRFELTPSMSIAFQRGEELKAGIDHPELKTEILVSSAVNTALRQDLDTL